jgi:hypothetical protein
MMKKRKFGSGGMPSIEESVKSGNRVSRQVGEETKRMMPSKKRTMPPIGESVKSGNRMSKENAKDMKAVSKYAKGGKVKKRYDEGGNVTIADNPDEEMRKLMEANLAATRRREAEEMAAKGKPKAKPRAAARAEKSETKGMSDAAIRAYVKVLNEPNKPPKPKPKTEAKSGVFDRAMSKLGRPFRAVNRALTSANEQTKTQGRNMAANRKKSPDLIEQAKEAANPYKKAAGGKVSSRGDGIARKGKTKGRMI